MRTTQLTVLAALGLAVATGAARAEGYPQSALPATAPSATNHAPGHGYGSTAQFPVAALPTVAPSATDRAPREDYVAFAQFPRAAAPSVTTQPSLVLTTRVAPNR